MSTLLLLMLECFSGGTKASSNCLRKVFCDFFRLFATTPLLHHLYEFPGLEALNRDHHKIYSDSTNHDTHRERNGQSVYSRAQSSIEQLMQHQLGTTILFNHWLLSKTIAQSKLLHSGLHEVKSFPGCHLGQRWKEAFTQEEYDRLKVCMSIKAYIDHSYIILDILIGNELTQTCCRWLICTTNFFSDPMCLSAHLILFSHTLLSATSGKRPVATSATSGVLQTTAAIYSSTTTRANTSRMFTARCTAQMLAFL